MSHYNSGAEDKSAAQLEQEVDRERAQVAQTIEQLQEKVSVGGIIDQVMDSVSAHGGDVGRSLGSAIKKNPLPLALTGVGLAWLIASAGRGSSAPAASAGVGDGYPDHDDGQSAVSRASATSSGANRPVSDPAPAAQTAAYRAPDGVGHAYPADGAPSAGDRASGTAKQAAGAVKGVASDAAGAVRAGAGAVSEAARQAADRAHESAAAVGQRAARAGRGARDGCDRLLDEQPLVLGGLALAVGAAIGGALPSTRKEDEVLGPHRDRALDEAKAHGREQAEKARRVADAVRDEAGQMVDEAAGHIDSQTPDGATIVDQVERKAREAAGRIKARAERQAETQDLGKSDRAR